MLRHFLLLFFLAVASASTGAQPLWRQHLVPFQLTDKKWGKVNFCVTSKDIHKRKPLLLYLDGSGDKPLFHYVVDTAQRGAMMYSTITFNYDSLAAYYHIVFIAKPGIPFVDSVISGAHGSDQEPATPPEYTKMLSGDWRSYTASLALDFLLARLPVDRKKVIVMGYSEGAQIAPHVAVLNKKVTHVACFVGNGLNQFYDFIIQERLKAVRGEETAEEAQRNIDTLMLTFKDIYANRTSTTKEWAGHSYLRWASLCTKDPMDYMLQLTIPVYMAKGTADENTQILSTDYVALEFLRRGKRNLTYHPYPGCNHFFQKQGKDGKPEDHIDEAMDDLLKWLGK